MSHHCHARGCTTPCVPERLFCPRHWFMVPRSIQADVWKHYRTGQCDDMNPSKEWHAAADAAIGFVAMKEGKSIRNVEALELMARGFKTRALVEAAAHEAHLVVAKPAYTTPPFRKIVLDDKTKAILEAGPIGFVARVVEPPKPSSNFQPMVVGQRPPPTGRMTFADAMAAGAMCNICPLSKYKLAPLMVPSQIPTDAQYLVVGEGPGRLEEVHGKPFVGPTGQFLTSLLKTSGLDRARGGLLNGALCRGETDKEKARAAECCAPRLLRELAALPKELPILALGKLALKPVLGTSKLFFARGFYWKAPLIDSAIVLAAQRKAEKNKHPDMIRKAATLAGRALLADRVVLPTVHPAFVMRADTWKPVIEVDIKRFGRIVRGELKEEHLANHGRFSRLHRPEKVTRQLAKLGKTVAVDIETDGVHPTLLQILCVGVSDGKKTVVIHPWNRKVHAPLLSAALAKRTAVFHNGINFDMLALRRDGVEIDDHGWEDTILAHHVIGSHFPQRLDHCVSVYLDSGLGNWKMKFGRKGAEEKGIAPKHMEPAVLCAYNAQDVILDVKLWHALQTDLEKHRSIYEHDKALARITGKMTTDGIGVDVERRDFLRKRMKKRQDALKGMMRKLVKNPAFQVTDADIRVALFKRFKAPILSPTPTGLPSTASGTLEVFRGNGTKAGTLCDLVLNWRAVRKSRTTYIDAEPLQPQPSRRGLRINCAWKVYGTPTGRWSSRLQSIPRPEKNLAGKLLIESRVREIYVPRPGCTFVYFDISQAEARIAATLSGDPNFLETCKGDVHTGNALAIFPEHADVIRNDIKGRGKPFRDVAKNFMFGIVYGAAADTIYKFLLGKGFKVTLREVQRLLDSLRSKYRVYFRYAERNVEFCKKHGYLVSPFTGRRRHFGFAPKPEEVFNGPIQAGVADIMNLRLLELVPQLPSTEILIVGQFHDALALETPLSFVGATQALIRGIWAPPALIPQSVVCAEAREVLLPVDLKTGDRLSDL
jgi:uracil-DNA glycosylase family 4